jgi:hypothetical protein
MATVFMKHASLPGVPVVAVDSAAFTNVFSPLGWVSDPGPASKPTFALPATSTQTVKMQHTSLPGRTITVPYDAFYGLHGFQFQGWTVAP